MSWHWPRLGGGTTLPDLVRVLNQRMLALVAQTSQLLTTGATGQVVIGNGVAIHPEGLALRVTYYASGDEVGNTHSAVTAEISQDTATTRSHRGLVGMVQMRHTTGTQSGGVAGVEGYAENVGAGTVTTMIGAVGLLLNSGAGVITTAIAVRAGTINNTGAGTITTAYGVYVNAVTAGGVNYAIYTNAGTVRLGGAMVCPFQAFGADDATPSVAAGKNFTTANANPTTITALDGGVDGQEVLVKIADANTTVDFTGTTMKGNGGSDWTPANGDFMRCTFDGTNWLCSVHDAT